MRKKTFFVLSVLVIGILSCSGCLESIGEFFPTVYESQPTDVDYVFRYGYRVEASGSGIYELNYRSDLPDAIAGFGSSSFELLNEDNVSFVESAGEQAAEWFIESSESGVFLLGVRANVSKKALAVNTVDGDAAFSIEQIKSTYPALVAQYTGVQQNDSIRYVDPDNPQISSVALQAVSEAESTNAFVVAKDLFVWLKQNTQYVTHNGDTSVQACNVTFFSKTGDCDDLSFLYMSLCRSVEIPARLVRGYLFEIDDSGSASAVAHAWVEIFVGGGLGRGGWIPVECACSGSDLTVQLHQCFGVEDAMHIRLFAGDGSNEVLAVMFQGVSYRYVSQRTIDIESFFVIEDVSIVNEEKLTIKGSSRSYE